MIRYNHAELVRIPRGERPVRMVLTDEQTVSLLEACGEDEELRQMIRFLLYTAMRVSEMLGLTWNQVDFSDSKIHIAQQLLRKKFEGKTIIYLKHTTKSGSSRTIEPRKELFNLLAIIKAQQITKGIYSPNGFVFFTNDGTHLSYSMLHRHFKSAARKIDLPKLRIHDLRRTCTSVLLEATNNPMLVQKILGHAYLFTTLDYCESTVSMNLNDCEKLGRMLSFLVQNAASEF